LGEILKELTGPFLLYNTVKEKKLLGNVTIRLNLRGFINVEGRSALEVKLGSDPSLEKCKLLC
jgi:hypothetical protein